MRPLRLQLGDALGGQVVADDLAEDVLLAHAAGDELAVLRAEVEDEDVRSLSGPSPRWGVAGCRACAVMERAAFLSPPERGAMSKRLSYRDASGHPR